MELGKTEDRQTALDTFVAEGGTYLVIHQGQSSRVSATHEIQARTEPRLKFKPFSRFPYFSPAMIA